MRDADLVISRRNLLGLAASAPFVVAIGSVARAQDAPCVSLDALPMSQKSMRRSIGFKIASTDPNKHCGVCTFFSGATGGCGKCQLLSGGAVAVGSVCDSFAPKG